MKAGFGMRNGEVGKGQGGIWKEKCRMLKAA